MIEPGIYAGTLVSMEFGKASTGTPCIVTQWMIEGEDVTRSVYTYMSKNALPMSIQKLESIEFNGDFENPACGIEIVELRCTHEEYDEKDVERWDFARWGGVNIDAADKRTVKEMNAIWKKKAGAPPKKEKSPKTGPPAPAPKKEKPKDGASRGDAWDAYLEHKATPEALEALEKGTNATSAMEWQTILAEVHPDKDEMDFDEIDWKQVVDYCKTPF